MDNQTKKIIMEEIENKALIFKPVSRIQYRIRCPFCGDSEKNPRDTHCYIKCDYDNPDENIKYNCFLCNRGGERIYKLLEALRANQDVIDKARSSISNTIERIGANNINVITSNVNINSSQVEFINNRLGTGFTIDDFSKFRILWDMDEIRKYITNIRTLNTLPNNIDRINFLSDNKSMIISRSFEENQSESQWRKIPIHSNSGSYYVIQATINLFTNDIITISVAEGIMDVLSAYKNFNDGPNSVFIASLGSNYLGALQYMILKGFVGKNIDVKIYIDWNIDENGLMRDIKSRKWMFRSIRVYKNIKYKDIGTTIDKIKLMEVK